MTMKKEFAILAVMLPVVFVASGCDFFRKLAGRPTSVQIEAMADAIDQEEAETAARQARQDSLDAVKKYSADSLAAADSLRGVKIVKSSYRGDSSGQEPRPRYTIMMATFSGKANARKYIESLAGKGYSGVIVPFRNSQVGVGVCGTDDIVALNREFQKLKRHSFCPKGIWILETE